MLLKIVCCNCKKDMGTKEGGVDPSNNISHSICEECKQILYGDLFNDEDPGLFSNDTSTV